ncbi:unnamed protein product [Diatraea saccharalis]|nr:unnamed protein product [Diatraea saccharalis]
MASTTKQSIGSNGPLGKRKKSKGNKGSYLTKWLDKTLHHIQDSTPSMETYESYIHPNLNWPIGSSQFAPGYDPYRYVYGCPEPLSLPTLPTYYNPAMSPYSPYIQSVSKSIQVQRPRVRRRNENKAEEVVSTPNSTLSNTNYLQPKNFTDSQDFTSLPPIVTSVADTNSNSDMNTNEKGDICNTRRFSDPCVQGLPDVARPTNGELESESESESTISDNQIGSRLLTHLLDQIKTLKLANERLSKDLLDTRVELDNIRQQNMILQKGPNTNRGAASHTPLIDNGILGGQYSPGFLTDLVREIREAARIREDAMYARVRAMVGERVDNNLAASEARFSEKALDEIKNGLRASEADRRTIMDRITKLEDEFRLLRVANGLDNNDSKTTNGSTEDSEAERVRLRKELAETRRAKISAEDHAYK